ncbi:hypothetical protein, partial [uncultured Jatrophihabitans sp.]|uniref:hypothetical protein n=1 Tax=uncultured Jatrophihabitans sp. TaxID=1610747 RepID=UPI0035CC18AA
HTGQYPDVARAGSARRLGRVTPAPSATPATVDPTEVIYVAVLDRIQPAYTTWSPSAAGIGVTEDEIYVGRHRKRGLRRIGLTRMFYTARHRRD